MSEPLNVKHKIGDTCRKVYSYFKPISNSSSFVKNVVENEWLFPHYEEDNNATDIGDFVHDLNLPESAPLKEERVHADSDDDDVIDINNFDINCDVIKVIIERNLKNKFYIEDDPAALDSSGYYSKNAENENVMKIRTYDVSITYDKYYETPRIWLFGYDENGSPLKSDKIFEDILADYSNKTVTYDPHPCTGVMTASIHPCRHAEAMLRIVKNWVTEEKEPRHDLYLLFLLKFISGVIPTIEYDFTTDIELPRYDKN
ncbi:autophagy-related protein 3, putative [Plasmodium malariae]|uniref:Autophagy-related protein 3, putative n=1 Tax=Plasmodium malariae TaxID=5858 RepID=A0A1C3KBD2_PLAMA|nr:autophagy-related protein 3, putative [Plasmodium malariae]